MSVARVRDLVCLVADRNMQQSTRGILGRWRALGIREPFHEILVHPQHDPGCLHDAVDFLRPFSRRYEHALVLFDHEGCGKEDTPRQDLENELEGALAQAGWTDRAAVVVIEPELEAWVWSESPHVAKSLGWKDTMETLHAWLREGIVR